MTKHYTLNGRKYLTQQELKLTWQIIIEFVVKISDRFYLEARTNKALINKLLPYAEKQKKIWGLFYIGHIIEGKVTPEFSNLIKIPAYNIEGLDSLKFYRINGELVLEKYDWPTLILTEQEFIELSKIFTKNGLDKSTKGSDLDPNFLQS